MAGPSEQLPADDPHRRPQGADDTTVQAAGKVSEALEWIERARGRLFDFHQLVGRADFVMEEAAGILDDAGYPALAEELRSEVVGRNVLYGRLTFQVVEDFDDGYYAAARAAEERVRDELMAGRRHVFEAELKEERRTRGRPGHESRP